MTQDTAPPSPAAPAFPVVVLASSAGGIQALGHIFRALPPDFRAALAVVQHRHPRGSGFLAEVLQRSSTLPVQEVAAGDRLLPGRIYLAPANHHLVVEPDGSLSLSTAAPVRSTRPAADVLFASVAPVFTTQVIAVVLTGYDRDGTDGIRVVKQWGGTVIAQDEASSEVFAMPRSAIATGEVDDVLALQDIAPALVARVLQLDIESCVLPVARLKHRTRARTDVEQRRHVIVALLRQHPDGLTAQEICEATGVSKSLTASALSGLFYTGRPPQARAPLCARGPRCCCHRPFAKALTCGISSSTPLERIETRLNLNDA